MSKTKGISRSASRLTSSFFSTLIIGFFALWALMPFFFLLISSFKPGQEMIRNGLQFKFDLRNYSLVNYALLYTEREGLYLRWYLNSFIILVIQVVGGLFFSSLVGYALGKYRFKGRNLLFILVLIVMMIPIEILILPLYKQMDAFNLIDSYAGVVLPFMVPATGVFFFRQYTMGLPTELMESGRLDGCTEYGIYFRIMIPLMLPAFGAMTILLAMGSWNSMVWPMIVLRSSQMQTLPIGLQSLLTPYGNNYDLLLSGAVMSVLPILVIFMLNQKSFISGMTAGSIKG
ncbi:MAG: carbohydrate ABC transporter permease [Eubacteriales bacterium]|nr:carbohydrate ABC transporter permease [Eubacteriales bacterium]MDD3109871.1 carbohydrate ABC transporter permease [Eubacteriales bacterium]MDD3572939.1 carbohydrate ABC transporter permease [Eubacteriales bacterium]MDD4133674.1 carbohydrate ABC transporter permease [Eubacteriales bacterium]MDD4135220.1 carbohydrate ABC transporter permease [Eubacteriales bacterium]